MINFSKPKLSIFQENKFYRFCLVLLLLNSGCTADDKTSAENNETQTTADATDLKAKLIGEWLSPGDTAIRFSFYDDNRLEVMIFPDSTEADYIYRTEEGDIEVYHEEEGTYIWQVNKISSDTLVIQEANETLELYRVKPAAGS